MQKKLIGIITISILLIGGIALILFQGSDVGPIPPVTEDTYEPVLQEERVVTETVVDIFEGPSNLDSSSLVDITVNGEDIFVYETYINMTKLFTFTQIDTKSAVAIFDFEGVVTVEMTFPIEVTSAVVRPLAMDVDVTLVDMNTITFDLSYPTQYVVEINDDPQTAVHLFTNTPEEDKPDPNNLPENMVYIGPGVYKADGIPVESGDTVYIAGGALVYGQINTMGTENITIKGRGIISGDVYPRESVTQATIPIVLIETKNVHIEGITFLNSAGWTINAYFVDGFTMSHVNIITSRANGDGVSIQSGKNVLVEHGFVRGFDDNLVVKNYDRGTTDNVVFRHMTLWTDLAQSMEIGYETNGETMNNIVFEDITVLHNFHKPVISIHNADDAAITNVVFRNITVENAQMTGDNLTETYDDFLIEIFVKFNQIWSTVGATRGSVDGVLIENVNVINAKDDIVSAISGYSSDNMVKNVDIKNVTIEGNAINNASELSLTTNNFTEGIKVSHTAEEARGARLYLPYTLALTDDNAILNMYETIMQSGLLVPQFSVGELPNLYMGTQVEGGMTATATTGTSILVYDDETGPNEVAGFEASHVIDGDLETLWTSKPFTDKRSTFASLQVNFDEIQNIGIIRLYGDPSSRYYQKLNIAVYGIKSTSETNVYTKVKNAVDYEISPAYGHYVDIIMSPNAYKAIQLRIYHTSGLAFASEAVISEVEFYGASLTFGKVVYGTDNQDIYDITHVIDGDKLTYYESEKGTMPAEITIDLLETSRIEYISIHLPPLIIWGPRDQEMMILGSNDGNTFETIVERTTYSFDPSSSNTVEIFLENAVNYRYVQFIVYDNTGPNDVGAQISEITMFG